MRSLVVVAQSGAITEAASTLGLTQPALSRRIQQLEEELGTSLFERSRKGVILTEAGRMAYREAVHLVDRFDRLKDDIQAHLSLDAGTVRLGGGATAVSFVVPDAIARFQKQHPGVRFQVKEAGSREIEDDVDEERLELGIVTLPTHSKDFEVTPFREDEIVLVAPATHPLTCCKKVCPGELEGQGLVGFEAGSAIRHIIDSALREVGVSMNVVMELRSIPAILQMAATTQNLAFVSRLGVGQGKLCILDVEGLHIRRQLGIINKRGQPLSNAASAFTSALLA